MGEASHPGPQGRRTRDISDEVLDNLERELTLLESVRSLATVSASLVAVEAAGLRCADVPNFVGTHDEGVSSTAPAKSIPTWVDLDNADDCSVSSESCWGEERRI